MNPRTDIVFMKQKEALERIKMMPSLRRPAELKGSDTDAELQGSQNEILLCQGVTKSNQAGLGVFGCKLINRLVPQS